MTREGRLGTLALAAVDEKKIRTSQSAKERAKVAVRTQSVKKGRVEDARFEAR
jgi:hypothetical protein